MVIVKLYNNDIEIELEKKKEDLIREYSESKSVFDSPEKSSDLGTVIGNIFYNSFKAFFDFGEKLVKDLTKNNFIQSEE